MRLLSTIVVLLSVVAPASMAAAADPEHGKQIYAQKCAGCHGPDGKGNAKMEEMLKVKIPAFASGVAKSDAELLKVIANGKVPMPAFGKSLSRDDMEAVLHYAKKLGGK